MADNLMSDIPLDFQPEAQGITQQQKMAQMLMQQAFQQPQGQMISGRYVPPAITQQLVPLLAAYAGSKGMETAEAKQTELAKAIRSQGDVAAKDVLDTFKKDKNAGLQKALQYQQFPQVKAVLPQLSKSLEAPTSMQEFQGALEDPRYAQWLQMQNQAKGTNISVNTGQHGFDNALKLRSDFRAEPIYKGFEETKAAKLQIDQAAKMATPAGDLAAATKVMKILDPGSVVRESELGMAMAATGVEDKVRNYANMVITGEKLTPSQRKDFVELSDKLYNAAAGQFNQKRGEYAGIAERNKLDVQAAVGAPAQVQNGWRIK